MRPRQLRPSSLPLSLSSFIGRDEDVRAVCELVMSGARLVTLTGPGGVGKTRLALAVAEKIAAGFDGEIAFVSLAPIADHRLMVPTIARALSVEESADQSIMDRLIDRLQGLRTAIVLDNIEHVLDAAPDVATLLQVCPELIVLATGREPLRLQGEHEFAVDPLRLPEDGEASSSLGDIDSPALQLFVSRAQQAARDFALTDANRATVIEICRRLDGLPLALELAAARLRALSPADLLARLDQPLSVLTGGPRDAPDRQQTMRETIQWSYDLLTASEQRLFRHLAVFAGGGTLEAIEAVSSAESTLQDLMSLADKSLVHRDKESDFAARYSMLVPVRQFASEQLEVDGETTHARRQHAEYFARNISGVRGAINGANASHEMARIDREHDNIRAAIHWFREAGPVDLGLQMVGILWVFWFQRGYVTEGRDHTESLLAASDAECSTSARGHALLGLSWLLQFRGDYSGAFALAREAQEIGTSLCNIELIANAQFALGICHRTFEDIECAIHYWEQALPNFEEIGESSMVVRSLCHIGAAQAATGDLDGARLMAERGLVIAREGDLGLALALALTVLGNIELAAKNLTRASTYFGEALELYYDLGSVWAISNTLQKIASIARQQHGSKDAATLLSVASALPGHSGSEPSHNSPGASVSEDLASLRNEMPDSVFESAVLRGQAMSIQDGIALATKALNIGPNPRACYPDGLTPREAEVLRLIAAGRSNREMAEDLFLSVRTVERHVANIYRKIDVHNRAEAARYAIEHDLTPAPTT